MSTAEDRAAGSLVHQGDELFEAIFEQSMDAIMLTAPDGRIHAANPEACRMLGMTEREICERGRAGILDPCDSRLAKLQETRDRTGQVRGTLTFVRKDGTTFEGEFSSKVYTDRHGVRRTVLVMRDETARHRADAAAAQLAAIVEGSANAIFSKTPDGTILSWNAAAEQLYGYTAQEAIGRSVSVLVPPEKMSEYEGLLSSVARGEGVRNLETVRIARDGTRIAIALTLSPIRDASGQVSGASAISYDIRKQKAAEREREELIERLQEALGEVKTLTGLLPICVYCKKIRDDADTWTTVERYVAARSTAQFSHGICPACMRSRHPEFAGETPP